MRTGHAVILQVYLGCICGVDYCIIWADPQQTGQRAPFTGACRMTPRGCGAPLCAALLTYLGNRGRRCKHELVAHHTTCQLTQPCFHLHASAALQHWSKAAFAKFRCPKSDLTGRHPVSQYYGRRAPDPANTRQRSAHDRQQERNAGEAAGRCWKPCARLHGTVLDIAGPLIPGHLQGVAPATTAHLRLCPEIQFPNRSKMRKAAVGPGSCTQAI